MSTANSIGNLSLCFRGGIRYRDGNGAGLRAVDIFWGRWFGTGRGEGVVR